MIFTKDIILNDKNTAKSSSYEKNELNSIAKSLAAKLDLNLDSERYVETSESILGRLSPPNTPGPNRPKKPGWGE